jgi:two-component system nitrate/nitrite response regulator NarP
MNSGHSTSSASNAAPGADGLHVLVVDDSVEVRKRVAASVSAVRGVAVVRQAGDVPSALRQLQEREPDVVVLDIEMPGPSGLEFLELVRRNGCDSLIIVLSIHDDPKLRQKCAQLGSNFYFHKLTEFDQVGEVCREMACRRAMQTGSFPL